AVAHQIITRHDGAIFLESAPGRGTTVHVFLPLAQAAEPPADTASAVVEPVHVLIVEDDVSVATGLRLGLEEREWIVEVATTGQGAIEAARIHEYDVVILD